MKSVLELTIFIFLSQVSRSSVSGQSQDSLRSVSGSQVSLRPVSDQFQASLRPALGQSQVNLRSASGQKTFIRSLSSYFIGQRELKILCLFFQTSLIRALKEKS